MAHTPDPLDRSGPLPRPLLLLISLILICLIIGVGSWAFYNTHFLSITLTPTPTPRPTATPAPTAITVPSQQMTPSALAGPVSPLIFGTNVSFFDNKDQILNSSTTRSLLQQIHPTIIRMPTRQNTLTLDLEIQMAQIIKNLGASPLIILQGPNTSNPLDYNTHLIQAMNTIFGTSLVYYEFSNEEDYFHHTSAQDYVSAWNSMIPTLKPLATNAQFIGPVTSHYSHDYLMTFLQQANPQPDAISWHEYTCDKNDDPNTCLSNIDLWTQHIADARASMQNALGKVYPIMITEWNYAGNAESGDGKNGDPQFMSNWTTKALQTLAANRIYASMQYSVTDTSMSLISPDNTYTPQGSAFRQQYQNMIVNNQQPPPVSPPTQ
jgi:hypothetical protein